MDYLHLLSIAKDMISEVVHIAVFCVAIIAYSRTQKPVYLCLALASILAAFLVATYMFGRFSLAYFGVIFSVGFDIAYLVTSVLGGISVIWLILYACKGFDRKP
jgi:hypothetical protein